MTESVLMRPCGRVREFRQATMEDKVRGRRESDGEMTGKRTFALPNRSDTLLRVPHTLVDSTRPPSSPAPGGPANRKGRGLRTREGLESCEKAEGVAEGALVSYCRLQQSCAGNDRCNRKRTLPPPPPPSTFPCTAPRPARDEPRPAAASPTLRRPYSYRPRSPAFAPVPLINQPVPPGDSAIPRRPPPSARSTQRGGCRRSEELEEVVLEEGCEGNRGRNGGKTKEGR